MHGHPAFHLRVPLCSRGKPGFTLIELLIVIAIIAIIFTLALPVYSNYTIRTKVVEALAVIVPAKTATVVICAAEPAIAALSNADVGYHFKPSQYVEAVHISGPCSAPVITMRTRNTGASEDPVVLLTGENSGVTPDQIAWTCTTPNGRNHYVPKTCRG
jgi:prepilin-type N-terminal cleavage/methylation domain-containing protein